VPTEERALIDEVVGRLAQKHVQFPSDHVAAVVQWVYPGFARSRLRDYVPLLVERRANEELTKRAHSRAAVAGPGLAASPKKSVMAAGRDPLIITAAAVADTCVLNVYGTLDDRTYFLVRDRIIKASFDEPRAIIVDVTKLAVASPSAWAVFTSARWQIAQWPDLPMALVCDRSDGQEALRRNGISRYIPVYWTVDTAIAELLGGGQHSYCRRAKTELPNLASSTRRGRELIEQWLTAWSKTDYIAATTTAATELVENALTRTDGALSLRLEADRDTVTVSVRHASTVAVRRQKTADDAPSDRERVAPPPSVQAMWAVIGPESPH
jgi:hypothetical protein